MKRKISIALLVVLMVGIFAVACNKEATTRNLPNTPQGFTTNDTLVIDEPNNNQTQNQTRSDLDRQQVGRTRRTPFRRRGRSVPYNNPMTPPTTVDNLGLNELSYNNLDNSARSGVNTNMNGVNHSANGANTNMNGVNHSVNGVGVNNENPLSLTNRSIETSALFSKMDLASTNVDSLADLKALA